MRVSVVTVAAALLAAGTLAAAAGEAPRVKHEALACVPADGNARIGAVVISGSQVTSARVYFRAVERTKDYYLEMRRAEGDVYWAVLPVPEGFTKAVQYRIVVRDAEGLESSTDPIVAKTSTGCRSVLNDEEKRYASNLVIGLTSDMQPGVPEGFKCVGLVSKITVNGELRSNDECKKIPAAVWIAGGAAAVLGGGAIIINNTGGGGGAPVSSARPVPGRTH